MYRPLFEKGKPGFAGIRTFMHLPHVQELDQVDYAVIGNPFDTGASYAVGTRFGPSAIREMSQRIRPTNPAQGIDTSEYLSGIDYGDLTVFPGYIEQTYEIIQEQLKPIYDKGIVPIILGGDHSISYPHVKAAAEKYGPISLVHFDSHSDAWKHIDEKRKFGHGSMFWHGAMEGWIDTGSSIQMGMRGTSSLTHYDETRELGFELLTTDDVKKLSAVELCSRIKERVADRPVFLTFDIDFLDPVFAPGTGTPEVGGFTTYEALQMIRGLAGIRLVGCDLVEVLPDRDPTRVTALNAAYIAFEFITLLALHRRSALDAAGIKQSAAVQE
ncbi:agmatinase [Paenibacillus sp. GD4]|uniref:agmatinase n=1 Tax=Paenibacillus sp. GD4 TaxID=3068890 RepID=UPI0027965A01|nr:agmatinase [Paenibacillus sp. GD4]MDQ1912742.1 agmatinase [Paenibacillus sp. GD4]